MLRLTHVIVLLSLALALFLGLLAGVGQWPIALLLLIMLAGIPLAIFGARGGQKRDHFLLAGGLLVMLTSYGVQVNSGLPVGYLFEMVLFGFVLASVRNLWQLSAQDNALRLLLFLWLVYLAISLLSSAFGRSHKFAAIWQLQYNLKWPLMFGLGALIVWTADADNVLRKMLAWTWVLILPFIVIELAFPSVYTHIFSDAVDVHTNPLLGFGGRLRGPFAHSSVLASIGGLMAAGALVQWLQGRGRAWTVVALAYIGLVLLSGQRQEALGMVVAFLLILTIHWRRYFPLVFTTTVALVGLVFVSLYLDELPLQSTLEQWGLLGNVGVLSERAILTVKGLEVASQYFPLGSGLGTYGGAGAQKFDLSLFLDLGFGRYWWFREGKFIVDTYWPSVIAETGYIGAFLTLSIFMLMIVTLVRRAWRASGTPIAGLMLIAVAAMTLLLANTPTSAAITDPRNSFLFWLLVGAAWRANATLASVPARGTVVDASAAAYPVALPMAPRSIRAY